MSAPRTLFEANLSVIERAIARVCLDGRLYGAEAEDFASSARLALLVDDCAILRKFEGRSSFATYVTVVVRRLLADQHRAGGRWFPSAEAQRLGAAAVALEKLLRRDRRPLAEALAAVAAQHPEVSRQELGAMAAALPERAPRPRLVAIEEGVEDRLVGAAAADDRVDELDVRRRSEQANRAMRTALAELTAEDRVMLRLRFEKGATVAEIARALGLAQRPLYRRLEALLRDLRRALERAGVDRSAVADLIGAAGEHLQFGLSERKNEAVHPSLAEDEEQSGGQS